MELKADESAENQRPNLLGFRFVCHTPGREMLTIVPKKVVAALAKSFFGIGDDLVPGKGTGVLDLFNCRFACKLLQSRLNNLALALFGEPR